MKTNPLVPTLAASITRSASSQTYYTIRFLADRERAADAYRAYAYFRWVDDTLDAKSEPVSAHLAFIRRQETILEGCYRGEPQAALSPEEAMLVELIGRDTTRDSGLQFYLRNMMAVMVFDTQRRGKLISQIELNAYTRWLAGAVTEAMHHFIGHGCPAPHGESRYLAVTAAHITHMLRDTFDDLQTGYYNIPSEVLECGHITPEDIHSEAYRTWVRSRVQMARWYFRKGTDYLNRVGSARCRLAGLAYTARFERLLTAIEQDDYHLRAQYASESGLGVDKLLRWLAQPLRANPDNNDYPTGSIPVRERLMR